MPRLEAHVELQAGDLSLWEQEQSLPEVTVESGQLLDCTFLTTEEVEVVAVPIAPAVEDGDDLQPRHGTVDAAVRYGIDFAELAHRADLTGKAGEAHVIDLPRPHKRSVALPWVGLPERVILLGVGTGDDRALRRAGAALARATRGCDRVLTTVAGAAAQKNAAAFVEGYLLGSYTQVSQRTGASVSEPARTLTMLGDHCPETVSMAHTAARATWLVRNLTNTPSNLKTPQWLAQRAEQLAADAGLETKIWDEKDLAAQGFGGILAVGAGSASTPRLVTVSYTPATAGTSALEPQHVVIVGKGITYDTGGISIKPRLAMVPMKTDMAGAAVALATVLAAQEAQVLHRVTAVLPLAENHFGADSYRPSDVLTMFNGATVEVSNTDAEGRIVLADALAYADAELAPDVLIDVATLTGAASVGLGKGHAALFTSDAELVKAVQAAALETGEEVWHMPLVTEYSSALDSPYADLSHVPHVSPGGGAITAALFLQEFVGARRWAHLDIAGPARADADNHEITAGATGYGARLLLELLRKL